VTKQIVYIFLLVKPVNFYTQSPQQYVKTQNKIAEN